MSTVRPWAVWRRSIYLSGLLSFFVAIGAAIYFSYFFSPADCFDGVRNASEAGVDCGGACVRICSFEVIPPKVVWVNSFEVQPGQYNTVAYVENINQLAGTKKLEYLIELKNNDRVVASRSGETILPPNSVYPIFEGRIFTNEKETITDTVITIYPADVWQPAIVSSEQFRTRDINLTRADERPRLDVSIENTLLSTATDVEVVATIFNAAGVPVTASQTVVDSLAGKTTEDIVFTWPNSIAKTVRSCVVPTDVTLAIDLSGSMNNDNDVPPEPLTGALAAASTFAKNMQEADAVSLVTFATEASNQLSLTSQHEAVAEAILRLEINPEEETGFTNTAAALELAAAELNSSNHNDDARRVLVLLTDGLPTTSGDEDIISLTEELAHQIDLSGVQIYAIGLGESVDRQFIRNVASLPENAYFAPSSDDLATIYANITSSLCETGPARIDIIAKTTANFTPLQ